METGRPARRHSQTDKCLCFSGFYGHEVSDDEPGLFVTKLCHNKRRWVVCSRVLTELPVMSAALRKTGLLDVYVPDGEAEKKAPC